MNRFIRNTGFYLLIFLVVLGIYQYISKSNTTTKTLTYNQFVTQLNKETIKDVTVRYDAFSYTISGTYQNSAGQNVEFTSRAPFTEKLFEKLERQDDL